MKKKVNNHYLMKAWAEFVKERDGCSQCQCPWYDGLCDCGFGATFESPFYGLKSQIEMLAHNIVMYKDSQWEY